MEGKILIEIVWLPDFLFLLTAKEIIFASAGVAEGKGRRGPSYEIVFLIRSQRF